jgi:hypothetical protein
MDSTTTGLHGHVNIAPSTDFTAGSQITLQATLDGASNTGTEEAVNSFSLELKLKNNESAEVVLATLNQVLELVTNSPIGPMLQAGIEIKFEHIGESVFVYVTVSGMMGQQVHGMIQSLNLGDLQLTGNEELTITSGLQLVEVLSLPITELFKKGSNLKIEGKGGLINVKNLITFAVTFLKGSQFGLLLNFLNVIRKMDFNFIYDPVTVLEIFQDTVNSVGHYEPTEQAPTRFDHKCQEFNNQVQPELKAKADQFAAMGSMFLEPFKDAILAVNLDRLTVTANSPNLKLNVKLGLNFTGLSGFIAEKLA